MNNQQDNDCLLGYVRGIDPEQGLFWVVLSVLFVDNGAESPPVENEVELEVRISDLSPVELAYLRDGAYLNVYPSAKPGQQIVFSRRTWTQEELQQAKKEAESLMGLLADDTRLQFPFVSKKVAVTSDSQSFSTNPSDTIEIPTGQHVGAFGVGRRFHVHEGVDLYAPLHATVVAMEDGVVVHIGPFTGPSAGSPHWHDTDMVMVEGKSGVIGYGEIKPRPDLKVGDTVYAREEVGRVIPVLKNDKGRPMTMLHLELYEHGTTKPVTEWALNTEQPTGLLDPTPLLLRAARIEVS